MSRGRGARGSSGPLSPDDLAPLRRAGRIVADILDVLEEAAAPGLSTLALDAIAREHLARVGARAAFLGYNGFPGAVCISLNEELVHGIPSAERILAEGDLLKLDFGAVYQGLYGDAARSLVVGTGSALRHRLCEVAREALEAAIGRVRDGAYVGDLGEAIQRHVEARGFSVVTDFTGHGIGRRLHLPPEIPNAGQAGSGPRLKDGMAICIEPIVTAGNGEVDIGPDDWTAISADGSDGAHVEHTVLVGRQGCEVLTRSRR